MQRTGRRANMPSRPSNECNSPGLNFTESQRGHTRRLHRTRGSQFGQVTVSSLIEELLSVAACIKYHHVRSPLEIRSSQTKQQFRLQPGFLLLKSSPHDVSTGEGAGPDA